MNSRFALVVLLLVTGDACAQSKSPISYHRDVLPIFKRHCLGCHFPADAQGGLDMTSVATFANGGRHGSAFKKGKPDESLFVLMVEGKKKPAMPHKEAPLPAAKIATLRQWVAEGAKDDSPAVALTAKIPQTYAIAPEVTALTFHPKGNWLVAACRSEVAVVSVDGKGATVRLPSDCDLLTYVGFSRDGATLAFAGGTPGQFGAVSVFDFADGKAKLRFTQKIGSDTLFRGDFSPDGTTLALGGADGAVYLIPVKAEGKPRKIDLHSDWVTHVVFSPDGRLLITGGRDKAVKATVVETGQLVRSIAQAEDGICGVSATSTLALSVGRDRVLASYTLKDALGEVVLTGTGNGMTPVRKAAQYTKKLETLPGEITDLALDAGRNNLAVVGNFGEVRIYQVATGKRQAAIVGVPTPANAVAWSHDGAVVAVGGRDGQISLFESAKGKVRRQFVPLPVSAGK